MPAWGNARIQPFNFTKEQGGLQLIPPSGHHSTARVCRHPMQDGAWAGHIELQAASLALRANLNIYQAGQPVWQIRNFEGVSARWGGAGRGVPLYNLVSPCAHFGLADLEI